MKQGIFLRAMASDATEAVVDIVGVIGWDVWYPAMRDMLRSIPDTVERVVFDIYSPGGSVWDGNGIIQEIGKLKQHTIARVQVAASMATLITVACDERTMAGNGRFLIHNAWTVTEGDADAHEKRAKELRDCECEAIEFYASRTGKEGTEIAALMAEERWLTADEAMEWGFVSTIDDPFDVAAFAKVREEITADGKWPMALADISTTNEGGGDADDATKGTEIEASGTDVESNESIVYGPDDIEASRLAGFEAGKTEAADELLDQVKIASDAVLAAKAMCDVLQVKLDTSIAEARKLQGERDHARSQADKHKIALDESTAQVTKLLAGGLTYTPSVETWEQAMAASGNDYEKARRQFPEAYRMQRERDKANRK